MTIAEKISTGKTYLGIELGSTRIKACLIDDEMKPIASGAHEWKNRFENGYWTYSLDDIHNGIRSCYASLLADVKEKYGVCPETYGAMGVSAMMHGIMAFDESGTLLTPFRTPPPKRLRQSLPSCLISTFPSAGAAHISISLCLTKRNMFPKPRK